MNRNTNQTEAKSPVKHSAITQAAGFLKKNRGYFSKTDLILWWGSIALILGAFILFDGINYLTLSASLIGVTSLIFNAKGNPFGQFLMVIFSVLYGIISYSSAYYGEMITYAGMTGPMALFALISWLKNPFEGNKSEVKVNRLHRKEIFGMSLLTIAVTILFYYILAYFHTASLMVSTLSVLTSFVAVYLTFRRSVYFTMAYALNDLVLIVLWIQASMQDISCMSVTICFVVFFVNDIYGYINWAKMQRRQESAALA